MWGGGGGDWGCLGCGGGHRIWGWGNGVDKYRGQDICGASSDFWQCCHENRAQGFSHLWHYLPSGPSPPGFPLMIIMVATVRWVLRGRHYAKCCTDLIAFHHQVSLWGREFDPHCSNQETEAQGGQVTCLRTSQWSSPSQLDDKALAVTDFPCLAPWLRQRGNWRFDGGFVCVCMWFFCL